jgi:predicted transcriptional regulator
MDRDDSSLTRMVEIFRALGDPVRLRLIGLIAERPRTGKDLAGAVDVGAPTVSHHMDRLVRSGLVAVRRDGQSRIYSLDLDMLRALARLAVPEDSSIVAASAGEDAERAKVIRDFFDGERLKQIPAQRKKRVIVLQHLVTRFDPNREFSEREVSDMLKVAHPDFATLRRELVDYGYMSRAGGVYRVARDLPTRSVQVQQEMVGDEAAWLRTFLASAARS